MGNNAAFHLVLMSLLTASLVGYGQGANAADVRAHLGLPAKATHSPPAVIWLKPMQQDSPSPPPTGRFTLLQKNRMFTPHLLVIPVGSEVQFPNADPFFHNVFSLFDGKRFDLGLYEAGSTKGVSFSREGISYIFCNIHPEMSAVVVAISTRFYAIANAHGSFEIQNVPAGEYELRVWVEGVSQPVLKGFTRRVHLVPGSDDLGSIDVNVLEPHPDEHLNKFGQPYDRNPKQSY